jgi:hypothetical protein
MPYQIPLFQRNATSSSSYSTHVTPEFFSCEELMPLPLHQSTVPKSIRIILQLRGASLQSYHSTIPHVQESMHSLHSSHTCDTHPNTNSPAARSALITLPIHLFQKQRQALHKTRNHRKLPYTKLLLQLRSKISRLPSWKWEETPLSSPHISCPARRILFCPGRRE